MTFDPSDLNAMRGKRKTIGASKYAQKLNQLKRGEVKVSPAVEASYKDLYGHMPPQQNYQPDEQFHDSDYSMLRSSQPQTYTAPAHQQQQQVQASVAPIQSGLKFGAIFEFENDKGDIEISCDDQGFAYSCDGLAIAKLEFAKGDSVPSRLKRKFKANQLYSVADVSIDLTEIAETFQPGDKIKFNVKEVKCFYQRHSTEELASSMQIEAEIKTDLDVDIPAVIQLRAHPLAKDLLSWTMQEILAIAQVDEIIGIIES